MGRSHDFGRRCEALAAAELAARGWVIVARNFRHGHKEVDLIVRRGHTIAFVEVKGRSGQAFGHPLEAIGHGKRREVESAARGWIARHGRPGDRYRFDAVSVILNGREPARIDHIVDAWRPGE
ncbi:MAG: YraN family protein [Longimicrobiales bacterium]